MKKSVMFVLFFIASVLVYACGQSAIKQPQLAQDSYKYNGQTYTLKKTVSRPNKQHTKKEIPKIIFHEISDTQRNMTMGYLPIPNDWEIKKQVDSDGVCVTGPNRIKVYGERFDNFVYSQLPGYNQMVTGTGQKVRPLKNMDQLINEDFEPLFKKNGFTLIKKYPLPKQKAYDENYDQFAFKPGLMQKTFDVTATEWEDKTGNKILFVIRQNISYTQEACYWGYRLNSLEAPKEHFDSAKNSYLYTLSNSKYNPEWLRAIYMEDAQTSAQMGKIHAARMASLRAEGQAIIERGKAHSAMVDRNHERWMDTQLERTTITDPNGESFKVDAGSKEYWMNASHEYIRSEDVFYDPNKDETVNNETWTKMTINN